MAFDFKLGGSKELLKNVASYDRAAKRRLQDGMMEVSSFIQNEARGNLVDQDAIDTGELFDSIVISNRGARTRGVKWNKNYPSDHPVIGRERFAGFGRLPKSVTKPSGISHRDAGMHAVVSKPIGSLVSVTAGHGPFVEFGTIKMQARPFFGPAVEKAKGKAERLIAKEARRIKRIQDVRGAIAAGRAPSLSDVMGGI